VNSLPRPLRVLRNATLADGSRVDVELAGGVVVSTRPAARDYSTTERGAGDYSTTEGGAGDGVLDLTGYVLLPAPAEPHAHLDKARSWDVIAPPMGDLGLAIASWRAYAETMTVEDVAARARRQALAMLANGTTAIRTHVDVLLGDAPLRGIHALVAVREELRDLVDIQIVALPGPDIPDAAIEAALDAGADTLGGAPHIADDPLADLHRLLDIAERRDLPVDLHTDESLDGAITLGAYAARVTAWTLNASAGHCVRLGTMATGERDTIIDAVVRAGVGVIANPITNLYLQGWGHEASIPRGLTSARALLDAGARFAAGADNVRDPFNPVGRSDALETASLLVTAAHLTLDEAYAAVSTGAREVMGLPLAGPVPGAAAEFLAVRATSFAEVVADASPERLVIHRGSLVARSILTTELAPPRQPQPRIGVAA
jgi:cytosine deaminase